MTESRAGESPREVIVWAHGLPGCGATRGDDWMCNRPKGHDGEHAVLAIRLSWEASE